MSLYSYTGPLSAVTLPDGKEIVLFPGAQIELPDDPQTLDGLNGLGHLAPVIAEIEPPSEPIKTKKGGA